MNLRNPFSFQVDYSGFIKATEEEKNQQIKLRESVSFWKDGFRRLFKNPIGVICIVFLAIIILSSIFVPMFYPYDYARNLCIANNNDTTFLNLRPFHFSDTEQALRDAGKFVFPHIFGTDASGRDYFIRVLFGTRVSLCVGVFAAFVVFIVGTIYGSISGYFGGKVDLIMMRIVDIIYSLPDMLLIILLSTVLKQRLQGKIDGTIFESVGLGLVSILIVFALLYWVGMARMVRGQIIAIKQQEYVLAAKSIGSGSLRIIFKHLLPNCVSIIIVTVALQIPSAIFTESFLSYVGLGVSMPMPSLGSLASESSSIAVIQYYGYRLWIVAASVCLIVLSLNLLGDALRDAFDPKLRK